MIISQNNVFTIHTDNTTYQFKAGDYGYLEHIYYGPRISGTAEFLVIPQDRACQVNPRQAENNRRYSLDTLPGEYGFQGVGDFRTPAFTVRYEDSSWGADLRYVGYEIQGGKYRLPGMPAVYADPEDADDCARIENEDAQTLRVFLEDRVSGIEITLFYGVLPHLDIITRAAAVTNRGSHQVTLTKVQSACLDFVGGDFDTITFYGRWAQERHLQRAAVQHGLFSIGSSRGGSSLHYNPSMFLCDPDTTEQTGLAYSMTLMWSGNWAAEVEKDQTSGTRWTMGLGSQNFAWPLNRGETFWAPEVIMSCSTAGLSGLSHNLHRCIRRHVCRGPFRDVRRPVLVNSWEAAYFDFTGEKIIQFAKDAATCGVEMLVLDDGWFGKRDNDETGLGDWFVNETKLGMSLAEMVGAVNDAGLQFGIWFEPEMISEDSNLYRAHPDYAFCFPGREPVRGRSQLVLDFSREEVRACIFNQMCAVIDAVNEGTGAAFPGSNGVPRGIRYIKWDFNRAINDVFSASAADQGQVCYNYVRGLYDFLERLEKRYPQIMIEGCSSGGGRFDAGMLYYTPQIWCSDNTDAVDRTYIQYGTSFTYPVSTMGSHISACPNHQTGRNAPLFTRGVVAMSGSFGYELSIGKLSAEEQDMVRNQMAVFKDLQPLLHDGDYYRLTSPFTSPVVAWSMVSDDKSRFILNFVSLEAHANRNACYIKCAGLKPGVMYREEQSGMLYPSEALMYVGFPVTGYRPSTQYEYGAEQLLFTEQG
ncbi:MAG: alpha-galactosidase [Treponemataceae bacterium]|nr:alpha-galactosidase [Treponemataceae bacterium]